MHTSLQRGAATSLVLSLMACGGGGDSVGASSSSASGNGSGSGGGGASASSSASAASASSSGTGGQGGGGGKDWTGVDPLANLGQVTEVSSGHVFLEGPVWFAAAGVLRFTDEGGNVDTIYELKPPSMSPTVYRHPDNNANGLGIDPQGRLIACEQQTKRVTRTESDSSITVLADKYNGQPLNSPNDNISFSKKPGIVYFTDPDYGNGGQTKYGARGVFRTDPASTTAIPVELGMAEPNGIALSPAEDTLYVDDSQNNAVWRFPVDPGGAPGQGKKWISTSMTPDGMAMDDGGNLYVATQKGVEVYKSDGTKWGTIAVPQQPSNCAFGGASRTTLYITAQKSLYQVALTIPGKP